MQEAFFLPASPGQRFCVYHPPAGGQAKGAVVMAAAFAEEMNKSRRMVAMQARALATAGHAVLTIDPLGCGDSFGDFGDATWRAWVEDLSIAAEWVAARHPGAPRWLWGHRAGSLLAVEAAKHLPWDCSFLFWQQPTSGKVLLQQFLRLKVAARLQQAEGADLMRSLYESVDRGAPLSVAGYTLSAALATGLAGAALDPPRRPCRAIWLELSSRDDPALLPVSQRAIEAWTAAGHEVRAVVVRGPAFWQTLEIEDAPLLIEATVKLMAEYASGAAR